MDAIEEIKEFIEGFCEMKNIPADLRFACLGDANRFCIEDGNQFSVDCVIYHIENYTIKSITDIKQFFVDYINHLWQDGKYPYNSMAIYVQNVIDMYSWYEVIVGGALFNDYKR